MMYKCFAIKYSLCLHIMILTFYVQYMYKTLLNINIKICTSISTMVVLLCYYFYISYNGIEKYDRASGMFYSFYKSLHMFFSVNIRIDNQNWYQFTIDRNKVAFVLQQLVLPVEFDRASCMCVSNFDISMLIYLLTGYFKNCSSNTMTYHYKN